MGRRKDEDCWNQVTRNEETGMWKCNHCGKEFKGGATRIKAHLGNKKGLGIALCDRSSVPSNEGVNNSTVAMAGSSDPMEVVNGMNTVARHAHNTINDSITDSSNHQNVTHAINSFELVAGGAQEVIYNYMDGSLNHQYDTGPVDIPQGDVVGSSNGGFENEISEIKELIDVLTRKEGSIQREIQWVESSTGQKRKRWTEVDDWLEEVGELKKRAFEMIELLAQGWSTGQSAPELQIKELIEDVHTLTEGKPSVLSNELMVGDSFHENLEELFALARDDKVLIIGVHGMGGVGKTALVAHFKNKISRDREFKHVFWVTVSQDFSIFKLQNGIAKRVGIKLDEDDEIVERAKMLSLALEKKDKFVLILDDVWNYIDLQKVGIPLRVNGIKLILTSRLKHVFQQMDCPPKSIIQIKPLSPWTNDDYDDDDDDWNFDCYSDDDDWELFLLKLGCYGTPATLSREVEKIARTIVKKCNGLPLGICVMARIMKGLNDIRQWRRMLNKFENSAKGEETEDEVFRSLKLSYDHLLDKNIQNCFLQCALYTGFSTNKLIMMLADEGLIKEKKSLEAIFDEGHVILDQLKGHSLLFELYGDRLRMNGLVRDMACYLLKGRCMVKRNKILTKLPDMQEWAHDLEKVSLMRNHIEEIPKGISPRCPRLSTLILSYNDFSEMPDCFFNYMDALSVLDLSNNEELISLPDSLSRLRSLKSLLLENCISLELVPPLGELQELSRLVISGTSIWEVPKGLAMLFKLKWLDLSCNEELTFVPRSVLFGLTNMQYLDLCSTGVTVEVENVQELSMLEYFSGCFHVNKNLTDYVENILDRGSGPKYYYLFLGVGNIDIFHSDIKDVLLEEDGHHVHFGDCEVFNFVLPRDLHRLHISKNEQLSGGMCDALLFKAPSSLRKIHVIDCPKLERLFCLCDPCSFCKHLQNLQSVCLSGLERLEVIWKESDEGICLPKLSSLWISRCDNMEKLLTPVSLRQLPNLETITVSTCKSMKEIFAKESNEDDNIDSAITLPKSFKEFVLRNLPQLKTVCTSIMVSESRPTLDVYNCPNLINGSLRYKSSHSDPNFVILL